MNFQEIMTELCEYMGRYGDKWGIVRIEKDPCLMYFHKHKTQMESFPIAYLAEKNIENGKVGNVYIPLEDDDYYLYLWFDEGSDWVTSE